MSVTMLPKLINRSSEARQIMGIMQLEYVRTPFCIYTHYSPNTYILIDNDNTDHNVDVDYEAKGKGHNNVPEGTQYHSLLHLVTRSSAA